MNTLQEARKEGYTDEEVQEYLAPRIEEARREGYSDKEIHEYLGLPLIDHEKANKALAENAHKELVKREQAGKPEPQQPIGEAVLQGGVTKAPLEAALHLSTGAVFGFPAYLLGGIGGVIARYTYSPDTDPKDVANTFAETFTFEPKTTAGKQLASAVTYPFKKLIEFSEHAGKKTVDFTGSAVAGALMEASVQTLPTLFVPAAVRRLKGEQPNQTHFLNASSDLAQEPLPMANVASAEATVARIEKNTAHIEAKLIETYEKTGIDPQTVANEAAVDPGVFADLVSINKVPFMKGGKEPGIGGAPPKEPPKPASPKEPELPPGSYEAAESAVLARISTAAPQLKGLTWDELYTNFKEDVYPLKVLEDAVAGRPLDVAESPHKLARLVRGAAGKAKQFLEYGTYDAITYQNNGQALLSILKPHLKDRTTVTGPSGEKYVMNDIDGVRAYIVSEHALELARLGIKQGIPLDEAARVVKEGAAKYKATADKLYAYNNRLTAYLRDTGLLSAEVYGTMTARYGAYIPFKKILETLQSAAGTGASLKTRNPIHRIGTSERILVDPLETMVQNTYIYLALAEKNMIGRAVGQLVKDNPHEAWAFGISVEKPSVRPVTLTDKEIVDLFSAFLTTRKKTTTTATTSSTTTAGGAAAPGNKIFEANRKRVVDALEARGFSINEAEIMLKRLNTAGTKGGESVSTLIKEVTTTEYVPEIDIRLPNDAAVIFRPNAMRPGPDQIRYFEDGKPVTLNVPRAVADAVNASDSAHGNMVLELLKPMASTLRGGAVLTPEFWGRNVITDQFTSFIFDGNVPLYGLIKGVAIRGKAGEMYQNWLKSGGASSAMASIDRNYLQKHLLTLGENTDIGARAWNSFSSPIEVLQNMTELTDQFTRLANFHRATKGATDKPSLQAGAYSSRETTLDFQRIGADMRGLNAISAFANVGLEGTDRTVRAFKDDPVGVTARTVAAVTIPSLLMWYSNNSTPERRKVWQEIRNSDRDLNWIYQSEHDVVYRFKKPYLPGLVFGSSVERTLDKFVADKPEAFDGVMSSLASMLALNVLPSATVPILEHAADHSFFKNERLVPRNVEGILPAYQVRPYTTELTKAIGSAIGAFPGLKEKSIASPVVIDNYIQQWTGGLGVMVQQALDYSLREAGVLPDPPRAAKTLGQTPIVKAFVIDYPSASAQSITDFRETYATKQMRYKTFLHLVQAGNPDAARALVETDIEMFNRLDGIVDALAVIGKNIHSIDKNPKMDSVDKRQLINTMYGQMIQMTRHGNAAMRKIDAALAKNPIRIIDEDQAQPR